MTDFARTYTYTPCGSIYVDPLGNKLACDLKAGHKGPHQCGGTQIWIEWENEEEDESLLQDFSKQGNE